MPSSRSYPFSGKQGSRQGSALLLTLLVTSLLLVLVLAFVVVIRIELRKSSVYQERMLARANARLGAELALSRLQEWTGVDTRMTFDADLLPNSEVDANNRYWVGVMDTAPFREGDSGLEYNPNYRLRSGWLVSSLPGGDPAVGSSSFLGPYQPIQGYELMVGSGAVADAADAVAVPRIPVKNANGEEVGAYAFWVGQENTKAQVNLEDPFAFDGKADTDPWRAITAQRSGTEAVFSAFDPGDEAQRLSMGRVQSLRQLSLLGSGAGAELKENFHTVSIGAFGLAVNPRRGGLKRDLTPVFAETFANPNGLPGGDAYEQLLDFQTERIGRYREETLALPAGNPGIPAHDWHALNAFTLRADQANPDFSRFMFPPNSDMAVSLDPAAPHWSQLLTWGTLHSRRRTGNQLNAGRQTREVKNPYPVIAKYNMGVYHTMDWPRIRVHFIPTLVLWNPYSEPLSAREYYVVMSMSADRLFGYYSMSFQVSNPKWRNNQPFWLPSYEMTFVTTETGSSPYRFHLQAAEIPAGGAVIYSMRDHERFEVQHPSGYTLRPNTNPAQNLVYVDPTTHPVEHKWIELHPGLHGGGGYGFYIEEPDVRPKIRDYVSGGARTFTTHFNWWDFAGVPFYNNPTAVNRVEEADRDIAFDVNGLDPAHGWEIHNTAAIMIRGMGAPNRQQNLFINSTFGRASLMLSGEEDAFRLDSPDPNLRPWSYIVGPHQVVPFHMHNATPHFNPGVFPEFGGRPPSFDASQPFRYNSPGFSPVFPAWGTSWGLRLPDTVYDYATASSGGTSVNLEAPVTWLGHYNPTASLHTRSGLGREQTYGLQSFEFDSPASYIGGFTFDPSYFDLSNLSPDDYHAFVGHSDGLPADFAAGTVPRAILFDPPRSVEELVNPASLANAALQGEGVSSSTYHGTLLTRDRWISAGNQPLQAIGNSLQSPLVFSHQAQRSFFATPHWDGSVENAPDSPPFSQEHAANHFDILYTYRGQYDHSWIFNHTLWDDFFFTPDSNSRLMWRDGAVSRDFNDSAARVAIAGAFNVNSTSVKAWEVLLRSLLDVDIPNRSGAAEVADEVERVPFARMLRPWDSSFSPLSGDRHDDMLAYTGYRRLTEGEITALAESLVEEVRERGPFLSVADFVNRRLRRPDEDPNNHRLKGAMQAAIERAGLNDAFLDPSDPDATIDPGDFPGTFNGRSRFRGYDVEAAAGSAHVGAPGYLMQSDVLARIGAVLQTRSDTFTIRSYGSTNSGARAWYELLVRRLPEYVDPVDPPERAPVNLNPVNSRFGRRYEILQARWLREEDL